MKRYLIVMQLLTAFCWYRIYCEAVKFPGAQYFFFEGLLRILRTDSDLPVEIALLI